MKYFAGGDVGLPKLMLHTCSPIRGRPHGADCRDRAEPRPMNTRISRQLREIPAEHLDRGGMARHNAALTIPA